MIFKHIYFSDIGGDIIAEEFRTIVYRGAELVVSNKGRVFQDGIEKTIRYNSDGYCVVSIKINDGSINPWRSTAVHILVALAFVPNPDNLPEVNHKDYDRTNPCADNLEWVTHHQNVIYSLCNRPDMSGEKNPNYGNRMLSQKYKENPELSREKQGRPGLQNGRCQPIDMYYDGKFVKSFPYMLPCMQYLIDVGATKNKDVEYVRVRVNKSIKENKVIYKYYTFVKH